MDNVKIEKLDNEGRGICYINNKITFVFNALPKEIVNIKIIKETSKYNEAIVTKYISYSERRIDNICPYFNFCGGCNLLNMSYEDTCSFKENKLKDIMYKYAKLSIPISFIPSKNSLHYRNKITLKVIDRKIGYYKESSHKLLEISNCLLAREAIQNILPDLKYLDIINGEVCIRCNYNDELLIIINTKDNINIDIDIDYLKRKHKIVGIVLNGKTLVGDNYFIEIVNNKMFKVSYDSFFQINRDICSEIFNLLNKYINNDSVLLDLYCGVGSLGLSINSNNKKIYGLEIIENAILNCVSNAKLNKVDNAYYLLGDVAKNITKIKDKIDTVIVDPPRAGNDKKTIESIIKLSPSQIIYISCNPMTLARDINLLKEHYNVEEIIGLDMFPYTHHVECFCVLKLF